MFTPNLHTMPVKLLFFGVLTDVTGTHEVALEPVADVAALKAAVTAQFPGVAEYQFNVAVNQEIIHENAPIKDGDEVAFMPPYSGG